MRHSLEYMVQPTRLRMGIGLAFACLLGLVAYLMFERSVGWFNRWIYTHWLFNYDFGFVKRGLIGELVSRFGFSRGFHDLFEVAKWNQHIVNGLVVSMLLIPVLRHGLSGGWVLFSLVCITSPATLQHMASFVGRVNFFATLLALVFLLLAPHLRRGVSLALMVLVGCLSVAIHEASLLLRLPLLLAVFVWLYRDERGTLAWAVVAGTIFMALAILLGEKTTRFPMDELAYLEFLQASYLHVHHLAVKVLFTGLAENMATSMTWLFSLSSAVQHAVFLLVMAPTAVVLWRSAKAAWVPVSRETDAHLLGPMFVMACLSPLLLYFLGVDFFRWQSNVLLNAFLLLAFLSRDARVHAALAAVNRQGWTWALLAVGVAWFAGPTGDYFSFSWARSLLN